MSKPKGDGSVAVKTFGYACGGVLEVALLQPTDTAKTRMQLDKTGKYGGMLRTASIVAREEGVLALWKGLAPMTGHLVWKNTVRMGSYATIMEAWRAPDGTMTTPRQMGAGACAGVLEAAVAVTPFGLLTIRLQEQTGPAETHKYRGLIHCLRTILKEEGIAGVWQGCCPTMLRNGINAMVMFAAKDNADCVLWGKEKGAIANLAPWQSMISGMIAGGLGPLVSAPCDIVKTRFQCAGGKKKMGYNGTLHAMARIAREEGVHVLWRGLIPRLARLTGGQGITWAVTDKIVYTLTVGAA